MNFTSVEVKIQNPPAGLPIGRSKREGTDHQRSEGEPYCGADPKAKDANGITALDAAPHSRQLCTSMGMSVMR